LNNNEKPEKQLRRPKNHSNFQANKTLTIETFFPIFGFGKLKQDYAHVTLRKEL
jgi:hypothetical protein